MESCQEYSYTECNSLMESALHQEANSCGYNTVYNALGRRREPHCSDYLIFYFQNPQVKIRKIEHESNDKDTKFVIQSNNDVRTEIHDELVKLASKNGYRRCDKCGQWARMNGEMVKAVLDHSEGIYCTCCVREQHEKQQRRQRQQQQQQQQRQQRQQLQQQQQRHQRHQRHGRERQQLERQSAQGQVMPTSMHHNSGEGYPNVNSNYFGDPDPRQISYNNDYGK